MANPEEMPDSDADDEVHDLPADDHGVQELEDGSAIVTMDEEKEDAEVAENEDFYRNLASDFDTITLETLSTDLLKSIEIDKQSRAKRVKEYEDALKRTGLGKEAPGGESFEGASTVVHPILIESAIDYGSRVVSELLPPEGPVKVYTPGEITKERADKAKRKAAHMNWQFRTQMKEFKSELERLAPQEALSGVAYLRLVYDSYRKRPIPIFISLDHIYLPYSAGNLYTAERVTWAENITQLEFEKRIRDEIYLEVTDKSPPSQAPDKTKVEEANEKIEGKTDTSMNEDGVRCVFLTQAYAELEDDENPDERPVPYLISIDQTSRQVVSIVRNWEQDDETFEPMQWIVEWPFIPWMGAYPIGLNQVMAGIPGAVTGALRALLDSAHINNLPTLLRLKGTNTPGQSQELNVTSITEIQGGVSGDDIRKLMMAVPYNPPSTVLFQLMGAMVEAGKGIVRTTFENLAEQAPDMPAMLGMALIEQGMKVMGAIHLRQWTAMDNVISILHRINRLYITDEEIIDETGTRLAFRSDYQGPLDCIPTADPQVFSDAQRFAQINTISQRAQGNPLYDQRKVEELILDRTRIPNAKDLLVPKAEPTEMNQVNENMAMALGRPVSAFPEQDHLGHIQVMVDFMESPLFGSSSLFAYPFLSAALEHLKQHMLFWYVSEFYTIVTETSGQDLGKMMKDAGVETKQEIDKTLAAASSHVIEASTSVFQKLPDVITRAQQLIEKYAPKMPPDPTGSVATAQIMAGVKREEIQARTQDTTQKVAVQREGQQIKALADKQKEEIKTQQAQQAEVSEHERVAMKETSQNARTDKELATKEHINKEDNLTALTIAAADNESGDRSNVSTGTGINPSP